MPRNASRNRGKAIYRVKEVKSPIHQQFRGLRIDIATPNMAGHKPFSDQACPSFDKPYFICYFGYYESWEYLNRKWPSIWRALQRMGFTQVEQIQSEDEEDEDPENREKTTPQNQQQPEQ